MTMTKLILMALVLIAMGGFGLSRGRRSSKSTPNPILPKGGTGTEKGHHEK